MPSLRDIRRRIRSVKNTAQITKAMEMVAASRMRRAQQRVVASRPSAQPLRELIGELSLASTGGEAVHPLLPERDPVRRAAVHLVYPRFISTLTHRPQLEQLLPVQPTEAEAGPRRHRDYIYEPSPEAILLQLVPRYVEVLIFAALLETIASEQSARMIAMRN